MPAASPVTRPVELIVAIDGDAELHVPPEVAFESVVVPPGHIDNVPVIGFAAFTVTVYVANDDPQLFVSVCVISTVPADTPRTTAELLPTVATEGLDEDHVPPLIVPPRAIVCPMITVEGPPMVPAAGAPFIVAVPVRTQPATDVYVIIAVPGATPVRTPLDEPISAMEVLLLTHVPPPGAEVNVLVADAQILKPPVIVPGVGFTVTT